MKTYSVLFTTGASSVFEVEAESVAEARDIAADQFEPPTICAQCSGWGNDQNLELGDWEQDESDGGVWSA